MTLRIGWLSPLTPASGVGTFSCAVAKRFPQTVGGVPIDLTLLYPDHASLHHVPCRTIRIEDTDSFRSVLELFDLLIYNIGNNIEHHETIFRLLRTHPGLVVCHDYVYQHYLADRSMHNGRSFASFAALLMKFGDRGAGSYIARSRITSRLGKIRYSPWDSDASAAQPMSEAIVGLGSALVVHSKYAEAHAAMHFEGPILKLGMPHDQKAPIGPDAFEGWARAVESKSTLSMVSFGHIQATKCIDLVVDAIAASKQLRRGLRYTIVGYVGDWDYLRRLEESVVAAGLQDAVRFETGVSDKRLAEIMRDADLFVNLRKPNTEGSSASLTEQLDSGRPVVVLDSGCYAEIPAEAAVKLPAQAGADDIRVALEALVADRQRLPAIGSSGRAHARSWTCASYGEQIVAFALEHRDVLRRRGAFIGLGERPCGHVHPEDEAWIARLARSRSAMRYLDRNVLMVDPELVMGLSPDELCSYVAEVILGIFDDTRLQRALARFFVCRGGREAYWACVKFALIVEAVMAGDEDARERLKIVGACYDPDFWDVVEALPFDHYVATAALTLLGRMPTPDELAGTGNPTDCEALAKRQALLDMLRQAPEDVEAANPKLARWLEQPLEHQLDVELPPIERDLDCATGSARFREHADLSSFYPQEAGHAWTRGARGFIGLRLGPQVRRVEVAVRGVNADRENPAVLGLSSGTTAAELAVQDTGSHVLALEIPRHLARSNGPVWLQLSTSQAGPPTDQPQDPRVLGVCLMNLKVIVAPLDESRTLPSPAQT